MVRWSPKMGRIRLSTQGRDDLDTVFQMVVRS